MGNVYHILHIYADYVSILLGPDIPDAEEVVRLMAEAMVTTVVYDGVIELECNECSYRDFSKSYGDTLLRQINDDWNDHLKESHNDR
jgi:hypothetical protein